VATNNPFTPTFGSPPPLLAGREELIELFSEALDDGPGSAGRATLYTGARGAGKTVLLNAVEDTARVRGWLVIAETATPGFLTRLTDDHLPRLLAEHDPDALKRRLSGFGLPANLGSLDWQTIERHTRTLSFRSKVELLTDLLSENETGLLITLDELHYRQATELREFGTVVQHAFRERRNLAFAGAALPAAIDELLNDEVLTFMRRADRHHVGAVADAAVREAIAQPITARGKSIAGGALDAIVAATEGYPFFIQLVGDQVWRKAGTTSEIALVAAQEGIAAARRRLGQLVHAPALSEASDVDKSFLLAMARDDGSSLLSDIAKRLNVDSNYAGQYRLRLIALELIAPAGYGRVQFALPYLRDYLREHAETLGLPAYPAS
jgi:AAA ATPase domain